MPAYIPPHKRGRSVTARNPHSRPFAPEKPYHEYLQLMHERVVQNVDAWIYDIIDGRSEQDAVVYASPQYMIVKGPHHSSRYPHLLGIPKNKQLHSIRDIRVSDIPMLSQMRATMEQYIKLHNPTFQPIVSYFHYPPSTYHLHLHVGADNPAQRNHYFDQVMQTITQTPNYYRRENKSTSVKRGSKSRSRSTSVKRGSKSRSQSKSVKRGSKSRSRSKSVKRGSKSRSRSTGRHLLL